MRLHCLWLLLFCALSRAEAPAPIALADFARLPQYTTAKISPNGEYLALTAPVGDQTVLAVLHLEQRKFTGHLRLTNDEHIADFWWVGPERLVATIATQFGSLESPLLTGELIGMDADGGRVKYLFGYRGADSVGSRIGRATATLAYAEMIDPLPQDPANVLIAVRPFSGYRDQYSKAYRLDVMTGNRTLVATAPAPGNASFLADNAGEIRYVVVSGSDSYLRTYWRERRGTEWKAVGNAEGDEGSVVPLFFSKDGNSVFFRSRTDSDRGCLMVQSLSGENKRETLACDEEADLESVITSFDGKTPIAAVFQAGYPRLKLLAEKHPDRDLYLSLTEQLGGGFVLPVSATLDGSKVVLATYSDRDPGQFLLFDSKKLRIEPLVASRAWIKPAAMAERRPISLKAREGHTLWGYLTIPQGLEPLGLPTVVMPHGGPFGVRDEWAWDADAQALASRGYAVLQVNFRGSGGYGFAHREGGRYGWAGAMIDDILDATRWAVEQKFVDPQRICAYGGSYGAYAALMSAIRAPELFRCVIGYAGVYDLELLARDSDIPGSWMGKRYIQEFVGKDDAALAAQSPVHQLAALKAPMLIIHGEEDKRTPLSQAKALRKALDARNHPYEWMVKAREGHGFYDEGNRQEVYKRMIHFLDQHLRLGAVPPAPTP